MHVPNIKELTKGYMNQSEISMSFFEYLGCGLARTNVLKVI